jgi:hypothetical protein
MTATNIPLDTQYVLNRLQAKLVNAQQEFALYEQAVQKYENDIQQFKIDILRAVLNRTTFNDYEVVVEGDRYSGHLTRDVVSVRTSGIFGEYLNAKDFGLTKPTRPTCEWDAYKIKELERSIELLKACSASSFPSKTLGDISRYL